MRILLVEDDPTQSGIMADLMRRAGHEVSHAASRDRAIELMVQGKFDVAVVDMVLVGSTGDTVAEHAIAKGTRVVLMSAAKEQCLADHVALLNLKGYHVSATLSKPFTAGILMVAINKAYQETLVANVGGVHESGGSPVGSDIPPGGPD